MFSNLGLKAIARAAFLESVGVAEDQTEVDVAELLVLLLITLEIADADAVWLVVPTPPQFSSLEIVGRLVIYVGLCVPIA